MLIRRWLSRRLEAALRPRGYVRLKRRQVIVDKEILFDWQLRPPAPPARGENPPADGGPRPDHPRLKELRSRYASFDPAVTTPGVWVEGHVRPGDFAAFRADNAYVWQLRGLNMNPISYALTAYYLLSIDRLRLLGVLEEDGFFECVTLQVAGRTVSRDLLDSVAEISFLEEHLGISAIEGLTVLDIGAGYGRLAHRMTAALPNLTAYFCTDAIAESTFISEYYLRFRGADRASVVPLDQIEEILGSRRIDLAINVHSFSECRLEAVDWWLSRLAGAGVRYFMMVPNRLPAGDGSDFATHDGRDMRSVIEARGYRLIVRRPKYADPIVQELAINPTDYYLFELQKR